MPKTDATTKHPSELLIAQFLANPTSATLREISSQLHTFEEHKIFFDNLTLKAPEKSFAAIKSFFENTIDSKDTEGLKSQQLIGFYQEKLQEINKLYLNDELSLRDTSTPTEIRGISPKTSAGKPSFSKTSRGPQQGK